MAEPGNVDVAAVRTAMNEVDAFEFPESTISQKIGEAEAIIHHDLGDDGIADANQELYDMAVRDLAKWRTWMATPAEMRRGALDLNVTYDVQTYTNRLRDEKDESLARIGVSAAGASAAIADHTDGVFPDNWG